MIAAAQAASNLDIPDELTCIGDYRHWIIAMCGDYYIGGRRFASLSDLIGYYSHPVEDRRRVRAILPYTKVPETDEIRHIIGLLPLAEVLTKPLIIIYQQSWLTGEVPVDWRLANVTPIYKKGRKEDPENYRPVSLTSVPGKVMEQVILSVITQHIQDNQAIRPSQHRFMKGRSCLTNLISFYDKVTRLVDEGKAVDVVYLDLSKAFDTVSHSILLEKLAAHGLDECTVHWVKKLAGPKELW
ncbi:rna-directed dna polymerase from mobile element jockey-like [Limosa lapponica baueri]|uniref:Rna-directed dna polymerase from mobile element jockey-like n=1 Tax=Limosa lapponica baueri TaxID=1758121 RepID=A0A2I0TNS1_LIMLA|nr:rna-directed dna polymerase from mobile element jockey-like [Limosa lapponica baueri]